jgi:hypothetical protein
MLRKLNLAGRAEYNKRCSQRFSHQESGPVPTGHSRSGLPHKAFLAPELMRPPVVENVMCVQATVMQGYAPRICTSLGNVGSPCR